MGRKMSIAIWLILIIFASLIGFWLGMKYGEIKIDSGYQDKFEVMEDLYIQGRNLEKQGFLPKGTVLYGVYDPLGKETMSFKVFFKMSVFDKAPIKKIIKTDNDLLEFLEINSEEKATGEQGSEATH